MKVNDLIKKLKTAAKGKNRTVYVTEMEQWHEDIESVYIGDSGAIVLSGIKRKEMIKEVSDES